MRRGVERYELAAPAAVVDAPVVPFEGGFGVDRFVAEEDAEL
jgi:hypothetical protein